MFSKGFKHWRKSLSAATRSSEPPSLAALKPKEVRTTSRGTLGTRRAAAAKKSCPANPGAEVVRPDFARYSAPRPAAPSGARRKSRAGRTCSRHERVSLVHLSGQLPKSLVDPPGLRRSSARTARVSCRRCRRRGARGRSRRKSGQEFFGLRSVDSPAARTRKGRKAMGGGSATRPRTRKKTLRRKPKEAGQYGPAEAFA